MKYLVLILLSFTLLGEARSQTSPQNDTIKVISYNIWNGFEWGKDTEREADFIDFINHEKPQILALQELCGFTQEKLSALAKQWGHPYAIIHKEGGYPVGITSSEPIELIEKLNEKCGHGALHVQIMGYDLIVTHLNPFSSSQRLMESNTILDYMDSVGLKENVMLMGDLNAHSPFDADYLEKYSTAIIQKRKAENLTNGRFDYTVISNFMGFPLIDICQKFVGAAHRDSFPTLVFSSKDGAINDRSGERIDYIMVSCDLEASVLNCFVANRGVTDYLSDHYPVIMTILKK